MTQKEKTTHTHNTYTTITRQHWYEATGETITKPTTLIYENNYQGNHIIKII